jgi:hypothetical protein
MLQFLSRLWLGPKDFTAAARDEPEAIVWFHRKGQERIIAKPDEGNTTNEPREPRTGVTPPVCVFGHCY